MARPPFKPTPQDRATVESLAGFGIPQAEICRMVKDPRSGLPITEKTLRRHFETELATGLVKANASVASSLFKMATKGNNVAAAIFWLKTRGGWREAPRSLPEPAAPPPGSQQLPIEEQVIFTIPDNGRDPPK